MWRMTAVLEEHFLNQTGIQNYVLRKVIVHSWYNTNKILYENYSNGVYLATCSRHAETSLRIRHNETIILLFHFGPGKLTL